MQIYFSLIALTLYLIGAAFSPQRKGLVLSLCACAFVAHGLALGFGVFAPHALRIGFAVMLSAAVWVAILVYIVENRNFSLDSLRILLLPQAALFSVLPLFFPGRLISLEGKTLMFPWHVGVALLAYSSLMIAALHALVMVFQDKSLHRSRVQSLPLWLDKALNRLPALLKMEQILFSMVALGFVLLSLTVLSGVIFSEQFLGVPFKFDHKTLLSLLSWLLFGVLLLGRYWRGWRGKSVLRMTLFGFTSLLLAYVGSRFVLEVLLHRSIS